MGCRRGEDVIRGHGPLLQHLESGGFCVLPDAAGLHGLPDFVKNRRVVNGGWNGHVVLHGKLPDGLAEDFPGACLGQALDNGGLDGNTGYGGDDIFLTRTWTLDF